jgi:hypothetical protein
VGCILSHKVKMGLVDRKFDRKVKSLIIFTKKYQSITPLSFYELQCVLEELHRKFSIIDKLLIQYNIHPPHPYWVRLDSLKSDQFKIYTEYCNLHPHLIPHNI